MVTKAKESPLIIKARKKLKQNINAENKQITPQALEKIRKTIHHWISRHGSERVTLKSKVTVFDENQHSAKPQNRFVMHLLKNLESPMPKKSGSKNLAGRIKTNKT
jgi:Holliday junction resolvase-like predicted endonuclease